MEEDRGEGEGGGGGGGLEGHTFDLLYTKMRSMLGVAPVFFFYILCFKLNFNFIERERARGARARERALTETLPPRCKFWSSSLMAIVTIRRMESSESPPCHQFIIIKNKIYIFIKK